MDIDALFQGKDSPGQLDMKLNFKKFFSDSQLGPRDAGLVTLACATSVNSPKLIDFAEAHLKANGANDQEIQEAKDAGSIMGVMNVFYRFRHWVHKEAYQKPAGLRMNIMARPITGKASFEMMAFAVSAINGCEACVKSHEESLLKHEVSEDKVYDLVRLSAIIKGLEPVFRS